MKVLMALMMTAMSCLCAESTPLYDKIADRSELEILSPTLAQRQSVKLRLKNGLEAYLISDPGVEQSAAGLAVEAGSWDDPNEYPGMAHFLEHMLFMGTGAYPGENEHMQYIGDYGGKVNAFTCSDRTVYMFSVNNEGFDGALSRFSHFFIDPLFNPSCINRELHAVDQEHSKNIDNDGWRQLMILKETSSPHHPMAKFSTGNAETLGGIPQAAMKQWYQSHYSAEKMHLVVLSSLPLDVLIDETVKNFSSVPNRDLTPSHYPAHLFQESQKGHLFYIKPVKDIKMLTLFWELPTELAVDQETHVDKLLEYILTNGNKNSLLGQLKKEHLAEGIQVGVDAFSTTNKLCLVEIELTDKGVEQANTVINYFFEALARLKKTGIPHYIFNEVQKVEELKYQYQARQDAFTFVSKTARKLVDEKLDTYPRKTLIPQQYNPEFTAQFLNCLTPENGVYHLTANPSKTHVQPNKVEKWMGAEYASIPISPKTLQTWQQASINPQIGLPSPNPFIPKNLSLNHTVLSKETVIPSLIQDNGYGKIFFAEDHQYLTPRVVNLFKLKSPYFDGSAKAQALADLYSKALNDQLYSSISNAAAAGSTVIIRPDNLSLAISIDAFSEPSSRLVEDLFTGIKKIQCTKEQFKLYKQSLTAFYENSSKELPFTQSIELVSSIIFSDMPTCNDRLSALYTLTYEQFVSFCHDVWKKAYIEGLIYGNLTRQEADQLTVTIKKKLHADAYPVPEQHKRQVLILPSGEGPFMISQSIPTMGNAVLLMIEQGHSSIEKRSAQQIIANMLKESFFDTLRTKQQTAYIAKSWDKEDEKQLMQYFAVQSSSHKPSELIARFELFLEDFLKNFTTICTPERFENLKKMAVATLQMPPENLNLMATRLFLLGFDYEADFNWISKRIEAMQQITYDQVLALAQETLSRKNSKRIAILLEGMTPKEKEFRYELTTKEQLLNQATFVAWR